MLVLMIISVVLMIAGSIMAVDGHESMVAIWRDPIYGLYETGLVLLIVGVALFMFSLVKLIISKINVPAPIARKCPYCDEPLNQNEVYCHKCGKKTI